LQKSSIIAGRSAPFIDHAWLSALFKKDIRSCYSQLS